MSDFFKMISRNEVLINRDYNSSHPIYYEALYASLQHYFSTFQTHKETAHFSLEIENNSRESLAFNYSDTFNTKHCISSCHNFFELLMKTILSNIEPDLNVRGLNFHQKIKQIKSHVNKNALAQYAFLVSDKNNDTLLQLNKLRNDMIHDVSKSINLHALDYIMSQELIPLIFEVIKTDINTGIIPSFPSNFTSHSGINIIEAICKINYNAAEYENNSSSNDLLHNLLHLAHLKEIGRACFYNHLKIYNGKSGSRFENLYENPHVRNESFALLENKNKYFYSHVVCYCCGVNSLITYKKDYKDIFTGKDNFVCWTNCYTCNYNIKDNLADPFYFGLTKKHLFPINID